MKLLFTIAVWLALTVEVHAQELFAFTEPASNMPAKSIGVRLNNWLMEDRAAKSLNYHFIPEIMWGANKRLMLHVEGYFSNRVQSFSLEGGAIYAKYRFYSNDDVYKHFRLAAFGRGSTNNSPIHQEEIETNGHNSGFEFGIIGTQLLHKTAVSSTVSYEQALNNRNGNEFPVTMCAEAFNYSLSAGQLILPKNYTGYKQTNVNLMVELLGQSMWEGGKTYIDVAPSVQFIFNSQTRLDIGYKKQFYSTTARTAPNGFMIRIEHLLFNAL